MSISAIMVTYNSYELTRRLLPTLASGIGNQLSELIVVDNASSDKTGEKLKQEFPTINCLTMPENKGYGAAVNAAAAKSEGEWLLILNGDVEISQTQIKQLKELTEKYAADLIAPAQEEPGGGTIPTVRNFPTPFTILFARRSPLGRIFGKLGGYLREMPQKTERIKGVIGGACFLIKKEKFQQIGGFDPNFFLYAEDTDLCKRLNDLGAKIFYTPEVRVRHFWGSSTKQNYRLALKRQQTSLLYYFKKHFPHRRFSRVLLTFLFFLQYCFSYLFKPSR